MRLFVSIFSAVMLPSVVCAEPEEAPIGDENTANNPLTLVPAIQVQNYYQPVLLDAPESGANQPIVRAIVPFNGLGGRNLMPVSLPVGTSAWGENGSAGGIGDLTLFSVRVFRLTPTSGLGVGPLLVAPTASDPSLGTQKWQIGAQGTFRSHHRWELLAGLVSYQQSLDGQSSALTVQPFVFRNIGSGFYVRSSGIISVDTVYGDAVVPIGLGIGKVTRLNDGNLLNVYVEPQISALSRGEAQPQFHKLADPQQFANTYVASLNLPFPLYFAYAAGFNIYVLELVLLYLGASLALLCNGPGRFSFDAGIVPALLDDLGGSNDSEAVCSGEAVELGAIPIRVNAGSQR